MAMIEMLDESIKKYLESYYISGEAQNKETLLRYRREARRRFPEWLDYMESTKKIREKFTNKEIDQLAKGERVLPRTIKEITFDGTKFVFAHITDTHMGSIFFKEQIWNAIIKEIERRNVDAVFHTGDITEGLSMKRMDAVYDLTHIGYAQQKRYAVEMLNQIEKPIYAVSGNHDRFYLKSAGAYIVEDIAQECKHLEYLGEDVADFILSNNDRPIKIRLWHGEDGSSYATSYRVQKIAESFTGGDKPNVLLLGHTHKQLYMIERNIHCQSGGAVSTQSNWMRSKKMANHTGFWITEMEYNERGITRYTPTFYPFYE